MINIYKRRKVIDRLKARAKKAYYEANSFDLSYGGRHMNDIIRGTDSQGGVTRYENLVKRLQRIDPEFPAELAS